MREITCIENCLACGRPVVTFHDKPLEKSPVIPFCEECKQSLACQKAKGDK